MLRKLLSASVVSISQHLHVTPNVIPLAAIRYNSSLVQQFQQANLKTIFKTHVQDPMKHTVLHEGLFYTVPENHASQILGVKALGTNFKKQCDVFQETCIMVRKPALEVLDYIKNANYDHPVLRIILYGEMGVGKTLTLAHALHACATQGWILVHVSWPSIWKKTWKEISMSTYKQGRIDFPVISVEWLKLFQTQNESFLDNLKTTSKYIWSKRESAEEGLTFSELIKFGLTRPRYATDVIGIILKELKKVATEKKYRVLFAVDGLNGLWGDTNVKDENKKYLSTDKMTLFYNFRKLLRNDWSNGMVIGIVDKVANPSNLREKCTPYYLLEKKAFEMLEPFIPVHIPKYSDKEIHSCLDYYIDRLWLQHPLAKTEEGKKELIFLSNHNPYQLTQVCAPW